MTRVIINGAAGRMGREMQRLIGSRDDMIVSALVDAAGGDGIFTDISDVKSDADVIIDFSNHACTEKLLCFACEKKIPVLIATTGHTSGEYELIRRAAEDIPIFHSANMSLGVALLALLAKKTAAAFENADIEIVETHHRNKLDAPSGTALMLAKAMTSEKRTKIVTDRNGKRGDDEIGICSVRRGGIVGIHEIHVSTENETITLKHEAHSRSLFADGALAAAGFLVGKSAGLYGMEDLLK